MTINIENETSINLDFDENELLERVVKYALESKDFPYECEVNIILTTDEEIQKVNEEFREISRSTDVLSFPALEYEAPGDFEFLDCWTEEEAMYCDPETGDLILGDMMISLEHVLAQADAYGHSVERELAFLCAHSMLHLFGYDHMEEDERAVMQEEERKIMNGLNITR